MVLGGFWGGLGVQRSSREGKGREGKGSDGKGWEMARKVVWSGIKVAGGRVRRALRGGPPPWASPPSLRAVRLKMHENAHSDA